MCKKYKKSFEKCEIFTKIMFSDSLIVFHSQIVTQLMRHYEGNVLCSTACAIWADVLQFNRKTIFFLQYINSPRPRKRKLVRSRSCTFYRLSLGHLLQENDALRWHKYGFIVITISTGLHHKIRIVVVQIFEVCWEIFLEWKDGFVLVVKIDFMWRFDNAQMHQSNFNV